MRARGKAGTTGLDVSESSSNLDSSLLLDNGCGKADVLDTSKAVPIYIAGTIPPPHSQSGPHDFIWHFGVRGQLADG